MKKALPIIIAFIVIAVLAIGGWFFLKRGGQVTPQEGVFQEETPAPEEKGFTGKLKDALTLGQSMKCTWTKDESNFAISYIKNEKIYTEVTQAGKKAYSIMVDNCTYSWEEGKTQGFKLCFEPEETEKAEEAEEEIPEEYGVKTPEVDYSCSPEVVADSMFTPPANINFISPLEMIGQ